jgi:short-subunit dehydrogenase
MNVGLRRELAFLSGILSAGLLFSRQKSWATAFALGAAGLALLPGASYRFQDRSVIITGGSRGLGLALAEQFLKEGASITLLARDAMELEQAGAILRTQWENVSILTITCDITEPLELQQAIAQAESTFGRIDILVNNAGSIAVGPFNTMEMPDFEAQLNLQLKAVIQATRLVLPAFRRAGGGRIANISSIGGMVPVPHMSTYCAAKFAMTGLSESMAAELAPENIRVTTVFPGLMRTGSPIQAVFKGNCEKEYAWFAAGDVMPGISIAAQEAARRIIEGIRNGNAQVVFPWITKVGILGHAVLPETYAMIMRQAARFMPKSDSTVRKTGAESQGWLERQLWYKPLQRREEKAEKLLNQTEKFDADFNLGVTHEPAL